MRVTGSIAEKGGQIPIIGKTLGHYQITEKLGEGGMGLVCKARDLHLDRFVALKILPPERVTDPERKRRFVQEAKAASALNHPNIITVHDIDQSDGVDFIAMEYVAGKTLDQRIGHRGLRLNDTLKYAVQIADALAKAHSAGIVHRDLKPTNIMVNEDGVVKVLDFGLAKLTEQVQGDESASTATVDGEGRPITEEGVIVGTVSYMSPEQAEGKKVDARSDIFSLGSVLYEMVTGQKAFQGTSKISTLSAILHQEPKPVSGITSAVPSDLEKLINRCLRKDPAKRLQHMDDVKVALDELKEDSDSGKPSGIPAAGRKRSLRWVWAVAAAGALALSAMTIWQLRKAPPPGDLTPVVLTSYPGIESAPAFSPDGSKVAFAWNGEKEDNFDIYIKQIGSAGPPMRLTTDPSPEGSPAWSLDDRWIAFTRAQQGNVAVVVKPPLGGPERTLTEAIGVLGLSWTPDGKWLAFDAQDSLNEPRSIWAVSVETSERRRLTRFLTTARSTGATLGDYSPSVSPDGRALAFARMVRTYVSELYVLPLTQDFQSAGEPIRIADQRYASITGLAWSADGHEIVYAAGSLASLWRVPVSGRQAPKRIPYVLPAAGLPAIAGKPPRLAYTWQIFNANLWRLDVRTKERRLLIGSTYVSSIPQYSPDGRKIAFLSNRSGNNEIWTCDADGSNCLQLTSFGGPMCGTPRWSPDSRWLALDSRAEGWSEIYVIAADGGTPRRLTKSADSSKTRPSWSQDGRWIYFTSDLSGRNEIWKIPVGGGEAVQVTRSGGAAALQSPDGQYLYYVKEPRPPGLFRMPAEGGEEKQLLPDLGSAGRWGSFAVTAKGVYFTVAGANTIQFLDAATGRLSVLATLDKQIALGLLTAGGLGVVGLCVSPDDAYVVWAQVDRNAQDLMLVENFR